MAAATLMLVACASTAAPSNPPTSQAVGGLPTGYPAESTGGSGPNYPGPQPTLIGSSVTPNPPETAPETAPGTASLSGVITARGATVVPNVVIVLKPGQGPDQTFPPEYIADPDPSQGDVQSQTDAEGRFSFAGIPPGKYFLFVWGPYGWREAEVSQGDESPRLIDLKGDDRQALGIVVTSWP